MEDSNSSDAQLPEKFKLDRTKIQRATLVDENDELNQLGLSVFNQADLEQGLIDQVDHVVSHQERENRREKLEKEIQMLENSIR